MPSKTATEGVTGGHCKIRKRGCSSSSSASSFLQNNRLKRAILGKRGVTSTPVPSWKMSPRSPSSVLCSSESLMYHHLEVGGQAKQGPVSARKLAATLWEMNELPFPRIKDGPQERKISKERRRRERIEKCAQSGFPLHMADPSHSPVTVNRSGTTSLRRKFFEELNSGGHACLNDSLQAGLLPSDCVTVSRRRLKNVSRGLTTTKELLKILCRVWDGEQQHCSGVSLMEALYLEIDRVQMQVHHLIKEQKHDIHGMNYSRERFTVEKAAWKNIEQEKVMFEAQSIAADLEVEKRLRRRTETLNVKLSQELADTKASLLKCVNQLEDEKRIAQILQQMCDELSRGIGEDNAAAEDLENESTGTRNEVQKVRDMLQLSEAWKEERVHMKLSEAKQHIELKKPAVWMNDMEAVLQCKRNDALQGEAGNEIENDEYREESLVNEGSGKSSRHSVELNMDSRCQGYRWRYAGNSEKRASFDGKSSVWKPVSKTIQGGLVRSMSEGIEWEFNQNNQPYHEDELVQGRFSTSSGIVQKETKHEDYRSKYLVSLKDNTLSASRSGPAQGFSSPTRAWSQHVRSQTQHTAVQEKLKVTGTKQGMRESDLRAKASVRRGLYPFSRLKQMTN